ncbi:MAG: hypothetical protein AB2693_03585 [Candidatus Thiodiazotropha sp.]
MITWHVGEIEGFFSDIRTSGRLSNTSAIIYIARAVSIDLIPPWRSVNIYPCQSVGFLAGTNENTGY